MPDTQREPVSLTTQLYELPGVSNALARALAAMGLTNVGKLVAHLPHRYEVEEPETTIGGLKPGALVATKGEVTSCRPRGSGRATRFEAVLNDGTGRLDLVWFHAPYMIGRFHPGAWLRVKGKCRPYNQGLQIANPSYRVLRPDESVATADADETSDNTESDGDAKLVPVYPASERAPTREIARVVRGVLDEALPLIEDHLEPAYRRERALPELREAYRAIHAPLDQTQADEARRRLAYDELLLFQLAVALKKTQLRGSSLAPALSSADAVHDRVLSILPYPPTDAQARVIAELRADLTGDRPMNRLLQGDVGSGKTMVALYGMLLAVASGHQAAMMAPTEILAEQHHRSLSAALEGSGVSVRLLTGSTPDSERYAMLERLAAGEIDLIVGTHALLTDRVRFKSLALTIIDEQHRFGVEQRAVLREKSTAEGSGLTAGIARTPHALVMTATPIPRTVAMTLFGDLDVSTIDALPPGRSPIKTKVFAASDRTAAYRELSERLDAGERGYVVAPAIDSAGTGGDAEIVGVRELMDRLEAGILKGRRLAILHGRLKRDTRDATMERFRQGQIDVLIATTVIEVGVDVPEATCIVIEHADRFGLSQLHQLRGRVGRGSKPGRCVLISDPPTPEAERRLRAMARTTDGFALAEEDFLLRGTGDLFGTRQSGSTQFRVANLLTDIELLKLARRDAEAWVERSPRLGHAGEAVLRRRVLRSHGEDFGLGDVA
ncbi:MAG: ATP-dependent DNA helicase RecG [Planctomycetota bacterium]